MPESYSRNFPTFQATNVGNIPFALGLEKSDKSDMENRSLSQRVAARLTEIGVGPVEAALSVGLERNYIRDLVERKKRSISQEKTALVAEALRWTVADLTMHDATEPPIRGIRQIPLLDRITAGKLKSPSSQLPVEDVPLLAFADLGRGEFFALKLEDDSDSMDRISPPSSVIVVNRADRTLKSGRCYVFSIAGETTYKMWQDGEPPYLAPYSTNPLHKPIFIKRRRDFDVIGRVKRTVLDL